MLKNLTLTASALVLTVPTFAPAFGEIANVGLQPGEAYFSVEGGFRSIDAPDVAGHGAVSGQQSQEGSGSAGAFAAAASSPSGLFHDTYTRTETSPGAGGALATADAFAPPSQAVTTAQLGTIGQSASSSGGSYIRTDDDYYYGFSAGYVFRQPFLATFERIEVAATFGSASASEYVAGAASGLSMDAQVAFASVSQGTAYSVATSVKQDLAQDELVFRLKTGNLGTGTPFAVLGSFEPFYRYLNQDTELRATMPLAPAGFPTAAFREASVTGNFYGAQLAVEASYPITPEISWIGRGSAGAYILDADGSFNDNFGLVNQIRDSLQTSGYRLGAESGFRFSLSTRAWLSLTGSVDYFSDVPTAVLPRCSEDGPAHIGTDDMAVYKGTARLTFAFR